MRNMSQREIQHRKAVGSKLTMAGSTLALGSLGAKGLATAAPKIGKLAKIPGLAAQADKAATNLAIGATGIGGASGFNFAAYTKAEAKQRKPAAPKPPTMPKPAAGLKRPTQPKQRTGFAKEAPSMLDFGLGSVHQGSSQWTEQVEKAYDPEANRAKRLDHAATAFTAGAGASAAGAAFTGKKAFKPLKAIASTQRGKLALKGGAKTAVLGGSAIGASIAADRIRGYKKTRGASYRPLRESGY